MAVIPFSRRLGWRTLRQVVDNGLPVRSNDFWRGLSRDLAYAMHDHHIRTPIQCAHFISQIAEESAAFHATEEFASGEQYEGRGDLGNTHPGDGVRFKGRSFMMITGRNNYRALPHWNGIDFEKHPQRLAERKYACLAAAWWWEKHGLNEIATSGSEQTVERITRVINGGVNGLLERRRYFRRAYPIRSRLTPDRRPPS